MHRRIDELREETHAQFVKREVFEALKEHLTTFVLRAEYDAAQEAFQHTLNEFVADELDTQRTSLLDKMDRLHERMMEEIDEVARSSETQKCIDRVQTLIESVQDIGVSVEQHSADIERNAGKLAALGRDFVQVQELRQGVADLNGRMSELLDDVSRQV